MGCCRFVLCFALCLWVYGKLVGLFFLVVVGGQRAGLLAAEPRARRVIAAVVFAAVRLKPSPRACFGLFCVVPGYCIRRYVQPSRTQRVLLLIVRFFACFYSCFRSCCCSCCYFLMLPCCCCSCCYRPHYRCRWPVVVNPPPARRSRF